MKWTTLSYLYIIIIYLSTVLHFSLNLRNNLCKNLG